MLDFFNNVDLQIIHKLLCDLMNFIINYVQLLAWSYTRENGAESFTLQQLDYIALTTRQRAVLL